MDAALQPAERALSATPDVPAVPSRNVIRFENVTTTVCEKMSVSRNYAIRDIFSRKRRDVNTLRPFEVYGLRSVTFSMAEGEVMNIVATNSEAKAAVAHIVAGLKRPDGGTAAVEGRVRLVGTRLGLIGFMSVRENLNWVGALMGLPRKSLPGYIESVLDLAELKGKEDMLAGDLDRGEIKRLNFVATLVPDADIYIFDGGVPEGSRQFKHRCSWTIFHKLESKTALLFSRSPRVVMKRIDRAMILHGTGIYWLGAPALLSEKFAELRRELAAAAPAEADVVSDDFEDEEGFEL